MALCTCGIHKWKHAIFMAGIILFVVGLGGVVLEVVNSKVVRMLDVANDVILYVALTLFVLGIIGIGCGREHETRSG